MNAGTNGYVELILNEVPYLDLAMGPWTFSPLDTKVRVAMWSRSALLSSAETRDLFAFPDEELADKLVPMENLRIMLFNNWRPYAFGSTASDPHLLWQSIPHEQGRSRGPTEHTLRLQCALETSPPLRADIEGLGPNALDPNHPLTCNARSVFYDGKRAVATRHEVVTEAMWLEASDKGPGRYALSTGIPVKPGT
ncbi:hypothetical protein A1Q2_02103 [Trichosporon asahii var. asahii CBS 8904]|uniref:Uncharacterized protein n=1 Tax=Trichosporon asahii var. asahii (strain CBS 8904) TaxID=1220162 RepID=K1VSV0_TRIAC|nr:hypothetical protein A1Q2_02103 [Trichosporon asahii var. asahii CBS 8904]